MAFVFPFDHVSPGSTQVPVPLTPSPNPHRWIRDPHNSDPLKWNRVPHRWIRDPRTLLMVYLQYAKIKAAKELRAEGQREGVRVKAEVQGCQDKWLFPHSMSRHPVFTTFVVLCS
jgi:hypothetical protein